MDEDDKILTYIGGTLIVLFLLGPAILAVLANLGAALGIL